MKKVCVVSAPLVNIAGESISHIEIIGSDLESLISQCIERIRPKSRDFYERELRADLLRRDNSFVDRHAGNGTSLTVKISP